MAQYDVHRLGQGLVIDCQSDLLAQLNTCLVAPLVPREQAPTPASRFNPIFVVNGADYVMATQFAGSIERRELGPLVTSLANRSFEIVDAFDILISGV